MGNYKLSNQAEADLYRIWLYGFQEFGEARADIYLLAFFERFDELAENPYRYPAVDHVRERYRRSICGVDSIYFRVNGETVEIMSIIGRQNTDPLFD